ncbi:unnamed protein product [Diamesa serratosioi]
MLNGSDRVIFVAPHHEEDVSGSIELKNRIDVLFYKKCLLNEMVLSVGDDVLILNDSAVTPDAFEECFIGRIKYLFEEFVQGKPVNKAIVKWFSRPSDLPKTTNINLLNEDNEVVQDNRYKGDINIDTIFHVACVSETKEDYEKMKKKNPSQKNFLCRYKIQKCNQTYSLALLHDTKLILKKIPDKSSIILSHMQSPHGRWKVKLDKISEDLTNVALNSIENFNIHSPKRKTDDDFTPKKRLSSLSLIDTPRESLKKKLMNIQEHDEAYNEINVSQNTTPVKKTRRTSVQENATPCTPSSKARRRSILKTPTIKTIEMLTNTPKKSIKFSSAVEFKNQREEPAHDDNNFQQARKRLHVSAIPKSLPCREKEFSEIYGFLEGNLLDESGGCMYVSGTPGTGKTATVTEVIKALKCEVAKDTLPAFDFVEINGMRITEPRKAYVQIYRQLTSQTVNWEQAYNYLDKRFSKPSPRRICTILIVDELDILCNKRQDVVYNLLNWPTLNASQLIVITIANTMDLPERVLMGKVTSRLGLTRLTFQPYSHKQLQEIVASRLAGIDAFSSDAIQLVARKVAALSGDARRALDICRRASEIAEADSVGKDTTACVSMTHVQNAIGEMISCIKVKSVKACSKMEKIFLQAVCTEVERTGVEEVIFAGVYNRIKELTTFEGLPLLTTEKAMTLCVKLGAARLLICEHARKDIYQKILLNISQDDFYYATKIQNQ